LHPWNATPRSPFFARCQPRSTSFSSGKIAICNRANLSNRLTTSLCRKRGTANRRIDGIVMNDSRAQPPILSDHPRPSPRVVLLSFLSPFPDQGDGRLSHRGIHDHPERFHRIRACRAFLSFFSPFFSLIFSRGLAPKSMEILLFDSALVLLRSSLVPFYLLLLFLFVYPRISLKEGFCTTESIEFRLAPVVTRQTNGKPDRLAG